jgi:hypothetical protein
MMDQSPNWNEHRRPGWLREALPPFACLVLGLFFLFHPMILSGFRLAQTDQGDPRLNAYFLEHLWKCMSGAPGERSLWNPGCGFPAKNIFAYSDTLMSFEPCYAPWRALGLSPFSAFQGWLMTVAAMNFVMFYAFLRCFFRYGNLASSLGAFICSFAFPRVAQLGHAQLLPQFYVVLLLWSVFVLARGTSLQDGKRKQRACCIALACFALVAQFYGGFYLAYFSGVLLLITTIWCLLLQSFRAPLMRLVREQWIVMLLCSAASAVALWPLVSRYRWVAERLHDQGRGPESAIPLLPRLGSFFYLTGWSAFYGKLDSLPVFRDLPIPGEQAYGFGFITTAVVIWTIWQRRMQPGVRLALLTAATALVLFVSFPYELRLWNLIYHVLPGIKAMRAIARIGLFLLIPAGIAIASFVENGAKRKSTAIIAIVLAAICCLEQLGTAPSFDKIEVYARIQAIADKVDPQADAFLYVPNADPANWTILQLDAMWAQQICGVRTVNVYSGSLPPGYPFTSAWMTPGSPDQAKIQQALKEWLRADPEQQPRIQIIDDED